MSLAKHVAYSRVSQCPTSGRNTDLPAQKLTFYQGFLTGRPQVYWGATVLALLIAQPFAKSAAALPQAVCPANLLHNSQNSGVRCATRLQLAGQQNLTKISQNSPSPANSSGEALLLTKSLESVSALNNRGIGLMNQGDYTTARALFDEALQLNPRYAPAFNNRAMIHVLTGNQEAAIQDYTLSLSLKPGDADVYVNRGLAFATAEKASEAIADYTTALQIEPRNAPAFHARAGVYLSLNNRAAARADLQQAAALYLRQGDLQSYRDLEDFMQQL